MNFQSILDIVIPIGVFVLFGALIWKSFKKPIQDMWGSISATFESKKESKHTTADGGMYGMGYDVAYR